MQENNLGIKLKYSVASIINNVDWNGIIGSIPEYQYLQKRAFEDEQYLKRFVAFYKIRFFKKKSDKQLHYFKKQLLSTSRGNKVEFDRIFMRLSDYSGKSQLSYASKIIATANPEMAVVDKHVLKNLSMHRSYIKNKKDRYKKDVELYNNINSFIKDLCRKKEGKELIRAFDKRTKLIPEALKICAVKKIDFMLWRMRELNKK
jgi:hypothetical protein